MTEQDAPPQDDSTDYTDLDSTAGSTAPDDLGSSAPEGGLTAGGTGTGIDSGDDGAGGGMQGTSGSSTGGTGSGTIGGLD